MSDVFISYSHVDNETGFSLDKGWIDWFFDVFDRKLRQLCGRQITVWRDHKLGGSDVLALTLEERVRSSKLIVAVLTKTYLESDWCRAELRMFVDAAAKGAGLHIGTRSRILKVLRTPLELTVQRTPDVDVSGILGYPFYEVHDNGRTTEYDPTIGDTKERQDFIRKVYELAYAAKALLDELAGFAAGPGVVPKSGIAIYVAEGGSDLSDDVERLRRELRQFGHTVLPEGTYGAGPDYEARCRADMARADVIVSPIGSSMGYMPEGSTERVVPLQYALARDAASGRAECRRLAWIPTGLTPQMLSDPGLAAALAADPDLRVCGLEEMKSAVATVIDGILERRRAPNISPAKRDETNRREIYLVADEGDAAPAARCAQRLYDAGYVVTRPLYQGDETERREDHEDNVRECDAVLVLHASSTEYWLRKMLRDVRRLGNGRGRPFLARGLIVIEGADGTTNDVRDPDLVIAKTTPDGLERSVEPFLAALHRARAEAG